MSKLLLIDDDERLGELLERYFQRFDIELDCALLPSEGLQRIQQHHYDLIILDIMLPQMDGFEVCKAIRKTSPVPIIMLTARGEVMDRIIGLELGADDYLPKPFEPRELVARIQTVLKRSQNQTANADRLDFGPLSVDLNLREACLDGRPLSLSSGEYRLLSLFVQNPGKTLSRDEILNHLKGTEVEIYSRAVDILVSRLRHKLRPTDFVKTVRGSGYCFAGPRK